METRKLDWLVCSMWGKTHQKQISWKNRIWLHTACLPNNHSRALLWLILYWLFQRRNDAMLGGQIFWWIGEMSWGEFGSFHRLHVEHKFLNCIYVKININKTGIGGSSYCMNKFMVVNHNWLEKIQHVECAICKLYDKMGEYEHKLCTFYKEIRRIIMRTHFYCEI